MFHFDSARVQGSDFESKRDMLSSFAEYRIRTLEVEVWDTKSSADWVLTHKPTELSRIKQILEPNSPSLWWVSIHPIDFTVGIGSPLAI